jgi:hypothetical protein
VAEPDWVDGLRASDQVKSALRLYVEMCVAERAYIAHPEDEKTGQALQDVSGRFEAARADVPFSERPYLRSLQDEADSTVLLPGAAAHSPFRPEPVLYSWRGLDERNMVVAGQVFGRLDSVSDFVRKRYAEGWLAMVVRDADGQEVAGIREPTALELPALIQREMLETARWSASAAPGQGPAIYLKAMLTSALAISELAALKDDEIEAAWSEVRQARSERRPRVAWSGDHIEGRP